MRLVLRFYIIRLACGYDPTTNLWKEFTLLQNAQLDSATSGSPRGASAVSSLLSILAVLLFGFLPFVWGMSVVRDKTFPYAWIAGVDSDMEAVFAR